MHCTQRLSRRFRRAVWLHSGCAGQHPSGHLLRPKQAACCCCHRWSGNRAPVRSAGLSHHSHAFPLEGGAQRLPSMFRGPTAAAGYLANDTAVPVAPCYLQAVFSHQPTRMAAVSSSACSLTFHSTPLLGPRALLHCPCLPPRVVPCCQQTASAPTPAPPAPSTFLESSRPCYQNFCAGLARLLICSHSTV